ncbi:hypothetical protein WN48_02393 [Eufriesea mexicana]|nr:hypothetical protein WN48_02393 [Eufriesea mexicana]
MLVKKGCKRVAEKQEDDVTDTLNTIGVGKPCESLSASDFRNSVSGVSTRAVKRGASHCIDTSLDPRPLLLNEAETTCFRRLSTGLCGISAGRWCLVLVPLMSLLPRGCRTVNRTWPEAGTITESSEIATPAPASSVLAAEAYHSGKKSGENWGVLVPERAMANVVIGMRRKRNINGDGDCYETVKDQ